MPLPDFDRDTARQSEGLMDESLVSRLRVAALASATSVMAIAALVLVGWQLHIELLKRAAPGLGAMAPGTAVSLLGCGAALLLLQPGWRQPWARILARALPIPGIVLGALTLAEYATGLDLRIDQLLFDDVERAVQTLYPGRISIVASVELVFLGLALLLVSGRPRARQRVARNLSTVSFAMSLFGLLGFMYGRNALYALPVFNGLALHTVVALMLLASGIIAMQPALGFSSLLASSGAGGQLSRRLLPFAIAVPVVLGWLRLEGEDAGLFAPAMGVDLMVVAMVALFSALIWWNARLLERASIGARRAEQALRAHAEEVRDLYEHAPCGYHSLDPSGLVVRMNETELAWLGYRRAEIVGKRHFFELLTPASQLLFHENFPRFKERGEIHDLGLEMRRKDGSILPVSVSASAIVDAAGRFLMTRTTVFDDTQRQRTERALRASEAAVRELALTDPLTGLGNRRRLDETLHAELLRAQRYGGRVAVAMADLDRFKDVNDRFGHRVGDVVLQQFARVVQAQCRDTDLVARFGGEEFVVLMPGVGADEARACAERIRAAMAALELPPLPTPQTASFGVAEFQPGDDEAELLHRVDTALYRAKDEGRNRVVVAEPAGAVGA